MKLKIVTSALVCGTLALAGCSSGGLLDPKANVPQATNVPVGNNLAIPPDLQLATPSGTTDAYQPNGTVAPIVPTTAASTKTTLASTSKTPSAGSASLYGSAGTAPAAAGDIFDQYGISKTNPDGTQQSGYQMTQELNAAILKKKRLQQPGYGTVGNIGAIFSQ